MTTWTPIRPTHVEIIGIHPKFANLLVVRVELEPRPPTRWRELFYQAAADRDPAHAPVVDSFAVTITPTDERLEHEVAQVEECVRLANARYAVELRRPRPASNPVFHPPPATVDQETFSEDVRQRIQSARSTASNLSSVFQSAAWSLESPDDVPEQTPNP